ncbi:hypothetical protein CQA49_04230 [Helicobacter sp. MIT 00-7814]|uniref:hypothetical protein n=1 Tax=unclassified Helicobacter TaxID=2593540 RepID=UPI000E1EDB31|nr:MULTISPECIES: hypothetical protein [unclassified Helicobacter]RDU51941.1 hypothetical protein CQA37_09145 [Helicobacter sp. MIT 99-10781]RDU55042.1 hypothetical protein CQA49_04230 [Helicobacter sp. MIT 00-7814]
MKIVKILLALFFTLASAQESDNTKDFESFELTSSMYFFTLKGSIDSKYPITIKLVTDIAGDANTIRAVNVKGVYLYDKFQKNIPIYGELKQESLELFTESKEESFTFKLTQDDLKKILDDKKQPLNITGEWKSTPKGKESKALQVVLSEVDLLEGKISRLDEYLMKAQKSYEPTEENKRWLEYSNEKLVTYYYEDSAFFIKPANIGILELEAKNMSFKDFEKAAREQMQEHTLDNFAGGSYEASTGAVADTKAIIFSSLGEYFYRSTPHPNNIYSYAVFSIKDLAFIDTSLSAFVNVDKKFINFLQKELDKAWKDAGNDDEAPDISDRMEYTTFRLGDEDIEVHFEFPYVIRSQDNISIPKAKIKPFVKKSSFFYEYFK